MIRVWFYLQVEQLVMDKLVRTFLCINMTGREYSSNDDKILYDFSHPHCQSLLDYLNLRREVLGKKYDEASYRPAGNQVCYGCNQQFVK